MDINHKLICKACGHENEESFIFCRNCGTCLKESENEGETALQLATQTKMPTASGALKTVANVVALVFLMGLVIAIIMPPSFGGRRNRGNAREKACYANMRVILGAIEMYNMDHNDMIETLKDPDATSPEGALVQGRYLKSPVSRPENECFYSGYDLSGSGLIVCDKHGTVEGGEYNR